MNEADTCRTLVTPKLRSAGWTDEQIREQVTFTHGRSVPSGGQVARKVQKRADYLLYYQSKFKVAVIEAKVNALREVQPPSLHFGDGSKYASEEELSALMPSILHKAFKGEL